MSEFLPKNIYLSHDSVDDFFSLGVEGGPKSIGSLRLVFFTGGDLLRL